MSTFFILLEQIKLFAVYMLLGMLLVKTKVLNAESLEPISRFVMRMALPLLIFTNTVNGVDKQLFLEATPVLLCSAFVYVLLFLLNLLLVRLFRLQPAQKNLYRALGMFGNIGFMGIPILTSLFAENGIVYIGVVTIVDQFLLWTIGVQLTSSGQSTKFKWKKMLNPAIIAILTAIVLVFTDLTLPDFFNKALTSVGVSATSLALIYLGGVFACMNLKEYLGKVEFYGLVLIKMMIFPLFIFFLLGFCPIEKELRMTMALLTAMPSMSSLVMMAKGNSTEGDYVAGGVFITTILSLVTLPTVCWLID